MKKNITILIIVILVIIGAGLYFMNRGPADTDETMSPTGGQVTSTSTQTSTQSTASSTVIGKSVEGRDITAYHYGTGSKEILFIGGIHGGYEWNTVLVAYQAMDYLKANPSVVPSDLKVTVIPVMNPDGLNKVVGTDGRFTQSDVAASQSTQVAGRFNAHTVDLGRNFDCDWKSVGTWQNKSVSGGTAAFSEPESQAIRDYVTAQKPIAAVTWYSAVGGVFASSCHNGVSSETNAITKAYADASGYAAYESFDFYAITGDMVNWFAKENIPAISVLLTNHTDTEWTKNQAGVNAIIKYYSK